MRGESIGKGYFGEVFQGFDYNSGQLIAIKSIPVIIYNSLSYSLKAQSFSQ
jgi:hypothetical protein